MTIYTKIWYIVLGLALCFSSCKGNKGTDPDPKPLVVAFPGADGGGKYATGGSGGEVIHVTTLSDERDATSGQPAFGTLRRAVQMEGTRTIVFDVSGTINLKSQLDIAGGNLTIAGQTAPGDGICIAGHPVVVKANNVLIRFLRFRMGDQNLVDGDALSVNDRKNVLIDHCSCSWSTDECVSCYGNTDFTLQYCFITESLRKSKAKEDETHGFGGIWGGKNASFHHNLLAHHDSRNPRFDHDYVNQKIAGPIDFVNNVVYNWGNNSAYGGEGSTKGAGGRHINFVNNYYKPGPATAKPSSNLSDRGTRLVDPWTSCSNCTDACGGSVTAPKIYLAGNVMTSSTEVTADNWKGATKTKSVAGTDIRWTEGMTLLSKEESAEAAYETVLTKAGCSLHRDALDARIVTEVRNGTATKKGSNGSKNGHIDTPSDAGGYPSIAEIHRADDYDTGRDGMPNDWEDAHGLDKNNAADGKLNTLDKTYTNLEVFLNELVAELY